MASASNNYQCDICIKRNIAKEASVWCLTCEESFCSDCNDIHRIHNILKDHSPISIEDYINIKQAVSAFKYECDLHCTKVDFYCGDHDKPICVKCVTETHKPCTNIKPLTEITDVKESFLFTDLQERASDIQVIVQQIITELSCSQNRVKEETDWAISMIQNLRKKINEHLDLLQDEIIKQVKKEEKNQAEMITSSLTSLQSFFGYATETLDTLEQARKKESNFLTYLSIKSMENEIENREEELFSLQKNLQYFDMFDVKFNPLIPNITTEIKEFATVKTKYTTPAVKQSKREKQGQQLVMNAEVKSDITLTKVGSFTLPTNQKKLYIGGCCIMESESMIFADYDNTRLIYVDKKGKLRKKINLLFNPCDVVQIDAQTVAVTSYKHQGLFLVDINQGKVDKTVHEGEWCEGLCYNDDVFTVSVENKKIRTVSLDGNFMSAIDTEDDTTYCYAQNENLYYTAHNTDTVYCCDMAGKVRWKYTCDEGDFPFGITVDNMGNVLVACFHGNKVISIDSSGSNSKVLLTKEDGINEPQAIAYNRKHNTLLVANWSDKKYFLYKIT